MYCKNCGNQINPNAVACLSCGVDPKRGNKHCQGCGVETNPEQIICIKCGISLKNQSLFSDEGKNVAIMAYITVIGFIIAITQHNSNKTEFGAYHLRQALGFMVTGLGLAILLYLFTIPAFGMGFFSAAKYLSFIGLLSNVVWVGFLICLVLSLLNAINGRDKPAPVFGVFYEKWFGNMFN